MEIIDCFCGIGPWSTKDKILPYEPEAILKLMDHFTVNRALVYANSIKFLSWTPAANAMLADAACQHPRFIPAFALGVHPHVDTPKLDDYLSAMRRAGAKALWLKIPCTPYRLVRSYAPWLIGEWMEACTEHRIPVLFHAEDEHPDLIDKLCSDFPDLRLILTGVGYASDNFLYPLLRRHPGIRVCLGHMYIPSGNPRRFLQHFPVDRLIFGSGLPEFSPGGLIAHVMYADITDDHKALILGGNLRRLMEEVRL